MWCISLASGITSSIRQKETHTWGASAGARRPGRTYSSTSVYRSSKHGVPRCRRQKQCVHEPAGSPTSSFRQLETHTWGASACARRAWRPGRAKLSWGTYSSTNLYRSAPEAWGGHAAADIGGWSMSLASSPTSSFRRLETHTWGASACARRAWRPRRANLSGGACSSSSAEGSAPVSMG